MVMIMIMIIKKTVDDAFIKVSNSETLERDAAMRNQASCIPFRSK